MGTAEVYAAIEAYGGKATGPQIKAWLHEKFPNLTYWTYYNISLKRLMKSDVIKHEGDFYRINEKLPERNIVTIGKNGRVYKVRQ